MAKMFYTQAEAASKLSKTPDELKQMVREGRLREFMDNGPVYRVEDINKMAGGADDKGAGDAVDLELAEEQAPGSKEDTVITSAGISVFDDEDLQIEVDPMAQTQITPSVEDQISLEGTGSGSGLLDLTREADDTSLGAELLEEIYPTAQQPVESAEVMTGAAPEGMPEAGVGFAAPVVIEAADPLASAFTGMSIVGLLVAAFSGLVVTAIAVNLWPNFLQWLGGANPGSPEPPNMYRPYWAGAVMILVAVIFWVIGMVIGKSSGRARA